MPESSEARNIAIASQIVRDVKVGGGRYRDELARETARLRAGLLKRNYIPGDKVNCDFRPIKLNQDGSLQVEIYGGMLHGSDVDTGLDTHCFHPFHIDLKTVLTLDQIQGMSLEDLLVNHGNDVFVDDGGNAQNMAIDICLAAVCGLRQRINILIFSSSDPLKRLPENIQDQLRSSVKFEQLPDIDDRIAIHLPWKNASGPEGTFGLTTEPLDIGPALETVIKSRDDLKQLLKNTDTFITSDLAFNTFRDHGSPGRYTQIVNAATKWRSTIAGLAYGTDMILPMNYKEAADVTLVIKHVGGEQEMHRVPRVSLPSPLKTNGEEIDVDSLKKLDDLLFQYTRYNLQHHRNGLVAFNCPITFEEHGGLIVGTRARHSTVAFTSTPDAETVKDLLERHGDSSEMKSGKIETMGAGDAAAAMVTIFNTIDPQEFIAPHLEGRETTNTLLHEFAQTILLSAMSRIVGAFLIHTRRTNLRNIRLEEFAPLFERVAKASLDVARTLVAAPNNYSIKDLKDFGMKVVTWPLGGLSSPDGDDQTL